MKHKSAFILVTILQVLLCLSCIKMYFKYPLAAIIALAVLYLWMTTFLGYLRFKD